MKILYVGDVMGEMGLGVIEAVLPDLKRCQEIDLVLAQSENVSDGRGVSPADWQRLKSAGVDFATGGNWSLYNPDIVPLLSDPNEPIIRPANYPESTPGLGYKYVRAGQNKILVISLLGQVVGRDADLALDNPLKVVDQILAEHKDDKRDAAIVNFHGDYSSEKVIIGHYLDGKVSAVIGDHWHVPTADARVLPGGTAHISDVGMCGALDSSLGIKFESVLPRWRDGTRTRNILESDGSKQFNAALVSVNKNGLAETVELIQKYF